MWWKYPLILFFIAKTWVLGNSALEVLSPIKPHCSTLKIIAASWQNQQNDMCAQRRLRSDWGSAQSDQSLRCPSEDWVLSYRLSALRRLWSDWADAQADLSLRWTHSSFCLFCHEAAQFIINVWVSECFGCLQWLSDPSYILTGLPCSVADEIVRGLTSDRAPLIVVILPHRHTEFGVVLLLWETGGPVRIGESVLVCHPLELTRV